MVGHGHHPLGKARCSPTLALVLARPRGTRPLNPPTASASNSANVMAVSSSCAGPTICTPTGSPAASPAGAATDHGDPGRRQRVGHVRQPVTDAGQHRARRVVEHDADAEVREPGVPGRREPPRARTGRRVVRPPGHAQRGPRVGGGPGHGPERGQVRHGRRPGWRTRWAETGQRHGVRGRPQSVDAARGSGQPDRTGEVGAELEVAQPGRQRRRGPARRAPGRAQPGDDGRVLVRHETRRRGGRAR